MSVFPPVPGFKPGDKVWPKEGPMVLQHAPQTVVATWRSPAGVDWLWLDRGTGLHPGSWYAGHWTTDEPDAAALAARKELEAQLETEHARLRAEHGDRWDYPVG